MYKDVLLKIEYYAKRIRQEYAKIGSWPNAEEVVLRLDQIDSFLSIHRHQNFLPGNNFNTRRFNEELREIGTDLEFLYTLRLSVAVKDLRNVEAFSLCHLGELVREAKKLEARTRSERSTISLGKTLLYRHFLPTCTEEGGINIINMDSFTAPAGSKLAMYINNAGVADEKIMLRLWQGTKEETLSIHRSTGQTISVPQSGESKQYSFTIADDIKISEKFVLTTTGLTPDSSCFYTAFCGEGKVTVALASSEVKTKTFSDKSSILLTDNGQISFYLIGATYANFDWTGTMQSKNFSGLAIKSPKHVEKIVVNGDAGFGMQLVTDGKIFAEGAICNIENTKLFYPYATSLRDFLINEQNRGEDVFYTDVQLEINGSAPQQAITVAVKCLEANYDSI